MKYNIVNTVVDTDDAVMVIPENIFLDGSIQISRATGSQCVHETLYHSRGGRYYIVRESELQGVGDGATFVSEDEAAHWIMKQEIDMPLTLIAAAIRVSDKLLNAPPSPYISHK